MGIFDAVEGFMQTSTGGLLGDLLLDERNKDFASDEAAKARHEQREMFQNRYQMTVKDLRAAGLNPILAVEGLAGSVPQMTGSNMPATKASMTSASAAAASIKQQNEQTRYIEAQKDSLRREYGFREGAFDKLKDLPETQRFMQGAALGKMVGIRPEIAGALFMGETNARGVIDDIKDAINKVKSHFKGKKLVNVKELMEVLEKDYYNKKFYDPMDYGEKYPVPVPYKKDGLWKDYLRPFDFERMQRD